MRAGPCQGFWPEGLYTAPTDEALQSDIVFAKRLGYNLLRKHIKVRCAWICLLFLAEHFRFVRTC